MIDDHDVELAGGAADARRDRVVNAVLARIAAAPAAGSQPAPAIDITRWTMPVLAAAAVIVIVSTASALARRGSADEPRTVVESMGLPLPILRYVETRQVDSWQWVNTFGRRP